MEGASFIARGYSIPCLMMQARPDHFLKDYRTCLAAAVQPGTQAPLFVAVARAGAAAPKKGAPGLTCGQVLILLATVLPWKRLTPAEALQQILVIQQQNHSAYLSHRKRVFERLDGF